MPDGAAPASPSWRAGAGKLGDQVLHSGCAAGASVVLAAKRHSWSHGKCQFSRWTPVR